MKKKKRDSAVAGVQIIHGALFHRCRRHLHHFILLLSAVASALLFLIAVISFLSPPITNHSHPHSSEVGGVFHAHEGIEREMLDAYPSGTLTFFNTRHNVLFSSGDSVKLAGGK
ncbi:uncharacterized protein LOC132280136 isoform X2 [Cornus florida]|uniref:uncharacterized protein LOC132280136 isoform X2 n=1 Tax=Cornus florida TaxID=4283 RepID=UPI00289DE3D5|nr:uncharacterized protein LOC132280136 isoform X2 [Cornus florida]